MVAVEIPTEEIFGRKIIRATFTPGNVTLFPFVEPYIEQRGVWYAHSHPTEDGETIWMSTWPDQFWVTSIDLLDIEPATFAEMCTALDEAGR